jgi:hypothetical protein
VAVVIAVFVVVGGTAHGADSGWTQRALQLQHELGNDVGMVNAPWLGTHNSFNSLAEMGVALSPLDSNQQISITDQLDAGIRSIELDLHWFPSLGSLGQKRPTVCHAQGPHVGCTVEKTLDRVLTEVRAWLRDNPGQVLMIYFEDHLDGQKGYAEATHDVHQGLAGLLYRPRGGSRKCQELPDELTRDQVLAAGRQVIAVGSCGIGERWPTVSYAWSDHYEDQPTSRFMDFPACDSDVSRTGYKTRLIRYYEDSTTLSYIVSQGGSGEERVTPEMAGRLVRCGVDLIGLDQVMREDPRLDALVWSWAPGQPASGSCSLQGDTGRWVSSSCRGRLPAACRDGIRWSVTPRAVPVSGAARACRRQGGQFAVPRTGYEGQLLKVAAERAAAGHVWLGQRRAGSAWRALDKR